MSNQYQYQAQCPQCALQNVKVLSVGTWSILCRCSKCSKDFLSAKSDVKNAEERNNSANVQQ